MAGVGAGVLDASDDLSVLDLRPRFRPNPAARFRRTALASVAIAFLKSDRAERSEADASYGDPSIARWQASA